MSEPKESTAFSWQQNEAIKYLSRVTEATRFEFYAVGIRMPTLYSLVRKGVVKHEYREDSEGRSKTYYSLVSQAIISESLR